MPELPEVESIRRQLAPLLEGRLFERVHITDGRLTRPFDPDALEAWPVSRQVNAPKNQGPALVARED